MRHRHYHFETVAVFTYPTQLIWDKVMDPVHWPRWWKGVRSVELLADGDADCIGLTVKVAWQSILPYRIWFISTSTHVIKGERIELVAKGDLDGTGTWLFSEENGVTTVRYIWDVHTTKPWMNFLAPIAAPFFKFAHDHLMRQGEEGLRRLLTKEHPTFKS